MRLNESYAFAKHAKPVRCPWCKRPAPALLFDSLATGIVCARCHAELILMRTEQVIAARRGNLDPSRIKAGNRQQRKLCIFFWLIGHFRAPQRWQARQTA